MTDDADAPPTFDILPLSPEVRRAVDEMGYVHPTPVQRAVFESAVRGRDIVVQARTGTGKTAAFGLPLIDGVVKRGQSSLQAMALCPTRELALQVTRELEALSKHRGVKIAAVYGGAAMGTQVKELEDGAQIVVGTPGRVLDHLSRRTMNPSGIRTLVLDECDEMLSMGFLPQITDILSRLPAERQTMLFSATVPRDVVRIAENRLRDPEFITLSGDHIGALEIEHYVYVSRADKTTEFLQILEVENPESAIVFCNTRDQTKKVAGALQKRGFDADWLNADLTQVERERVMARTREGKLRFLVATDVAARGIDVSHLTHVLNFDFPDSAEQYVHRTGRTGRAGRLGTAVSLVAPSDIGNLYVLRLTYKIRPVERTLPSARELRTQAEADVLSVLSRGFGDAAYHPDEIGLARRLLSHPQAEHVVAGLLREHLGKHPDAQDEGATARREKAPAPVPPVATPSPVPAEPARTPSEQRAEPPGRRQERPRPSRRDAEERHERGADADRDRRERRPRDVAESRRSDSADRPERRERPRNDSTEPRERGAEPTGGRPPRTRNAADDRQERGASAGERRGAHERREQRPRDVDDDEAPNGDLDALDLEEIFVNVGRRDGITARDLREALHDAGGVAKEDTGFVRVRHRHSFVGVKKSAVERTLAALDGATLGSRTAAAELARRP